MPLLSAHDDLMQRTLAAVPGRLRRLCYLAELRDEAGRYQHWGLEREHGSEPAQAAMRRAHTAVLLALLRAPLRELWTEYCTADENDAAIAWELLAERPQRFLPDDLGGGSQRHFSSVANALATLARARSNASRRAA